MYSTCLCMARMCTHAIRILHTYTVPMTTCCLTHMHKQTLILLHVDDACLER